MWRPITCHSYGVGASQVDPFTKPIASDAFVKHVRSLGLCRMRLNRTKHLLYSFNKIKSISHGSLVFCCFVNMLKMSLSTIQIMYVDRLD